MTFEEKMSFVDAFKNKVNEVFDVAFQSSVTSDGLKYMTASDLEKAKLLVETKDMYMDLMKGLAWDAAKAKDLAEENNKVLKSIEKMLKESNMPEVDR